jgi:RHS repeat-associated protein
VNKSVATGIPDYQNNNGNPPWNTLNPYSNNSANSARLYLLNAATNTNVNKNGLGFIVKVMAGDKFSIFGKSYHKKPAAGYSGTTNSIIVSELINAFAGTSLISSKGVTGSQITGQLGFPTTMNGLVGNQPAQSTTRPKAAINWILFDDQFRYVGGGFDMVADAGASTAGTLKSHSLIQLPVVTNGYLYVYVSNESKVNVFFDNLQVMHDRGALIEETHYYPFGLIQAGISSKALNFGQPENKKKFNGIEHTTEFDLNTYDAFFRSADPQIGRWWQIDPKPNMSESPYSMMGNNPIKFGDPLGDTTYIFSRNGKYIRTINDNLPNQVHFVKYGNGMSANFKRHNTVDKQAQFVRDNSIAFIGSNTMADAKAIEKQATREGKEIAFTGKIGSDREIRLTALPMDENNQRAEVSNIDKVLDKNFTKKQQSELFIVGHVHHGKLLGGWTIGDGSARTTHEYLGRPSSPNYNGSGDYGPYLYRSADATQRGQSVGLIVTPYGVTVYGTATSSSPNPYGGYNTEGAIKPETQSYILYQQIKK